MSRLCSYLMTHDDRFAPNPLCGVLTLATCKPGIRRNKRLNTDDWIAGWSAKVLREKFAKRIEPQYLKDACQYLIFLARVSEIIPMEEYWTKFPQKRAVMTTKKDCPYRYGDNIYKPSDKDKNGEWHFVQQDNCHHNGKDFLHDISGKNVLICKKFYYFSHLAPLQLTSNQCPRIPGCYGDKGGRGHRWTEGASVDEFLKSVQIEIKKHENYYSQETIQNFWKQGEK